MTEQYENERKTKITVFRWGVQLSLKGKAKVWETFTGTAAKDSLS